MAMIRSDLLVLQRRVKQHLVRIRRWEDCQHSLVCTLNLSFSIGSSICSSVPALTFTGRAGVDFVDRFSCFLVYTDFYAFTYGIVTL